MEYTDYYAVRGNVEQVRETLAKVCSRGVVIPAPPLVAFVAIGKTERLPKAFDWLLRVFDAEGSAWGFQLWVDQVEIASATFGENEEWGIDSEDEGFEGDLAAAAAALGTTAAKLSKCLKADGPEKLCAQIGFVHCHLLYPHAKELPKKGVTILG